MKKLILLTALLGACAADAAPIATGSEAVESQALVSPGSRGCAVTLCPRPLVCEEDCNGVASCVPATTAECRSDADCRLFSDYCEGCNCVALGTGESDPVCKGNPVACFVDPCLNLKARCEFGSCVAGAAAL